MPTLRILNWNVQNYGRTKTQFNDLVHAVATMVVQSYADIFILIELNTSRDATAGDICAATKAALQAQSPAGQWTTCMLSPATGIEFIAFFVKNTAVTTPLRISGPLDAIGWPPEFIGGRGTPVAQAIFESYNGPFTRLNGFPLISPDMVYLHHTANWTGIRYPVFGLFDVPGAAGNNRFLPIIACHFAANDVQAPNQIQNLQYFSPLAKTAPTRNAATPQLQLNINGVNQVINYCILCGDFNISYPNPAYDALENGVPNLGGVVLNKQINTHLVTFNAFNPAVYTTTASLAIANYDNFAAFVSPTAGDPVGDGTTYEVFNTPSLIQMRQLTLLESVYWYAEEGMRGLYLGPPDHALVTFCDQVIAPGAPIPPLDVQSALVGARILSDHLPMLLELEIN